MDQTSYICITCGTRFSESEKEPISCPICMDDRQYIRPGGQAWTTLEVMKNAGYRNEQLPLEPRLTEIVTRPSFAIGQRALLLKTEDGNFLWDCTTYLDDKTVEWMRQKGGLKGIVISHPHFYSNYAGWGEALDCPVYLHEADRDWVMGPKDKIQFWSGDEYRLTSNVTAVRLGGHFPGSTFLHWREGAEGKGSILTGDTIFVTPGLDRVSFMYSFPNHIPLPAQEMQRIRLVIEGWDFDHIHGAWSGRSITGDGKAITLRSIDHYLGMLEG
ncbi:hypothetical protein [Salinithrix halophila]|uniref:Metallo-beta-lactamase domain-containing protein n=1 Tax=Salinithrix halophila TaxID=1485204 RepID=A0ABV8JFN2_9BACL